MPITSKFVLSAIHMRTTWCVLPDRYQDSYQSSVKLIAARGLIQKKAAGRHQMNGRLFGWPAEMRKRGDSGVEKGKDFLGIETHLFSGDCLLSLIFVRTARMAYVYVFLWCISFEFFVDVLF